MNRYKRLDQIYNIEEYRQLLEVFPVDSFLYTELKYFLKNIEESTTGHNKTPITASLASCMSTRFPDVYEVMYNIPFCNLATSINTHSKFCNAVLKWRLTISK